MRAAIFEQFRGPLSVCNVPVPDVPSDAVLIEVQACGICRSDWHGWMGHDNDVQLPHVPGHELAGIVASTGSDVGRFRSGDRVTTPFCCGCGTCALCQAGQSHICDHYTQPGFTHWGAFAEYVVVRHADVNLVSLPECIDSVTAAGLGCRFATAWRAVMQQGLVQSGDFVAVYGCGGVGLSAVMIAAAAGARVIAIDVHSAQLQRAARCGAAHIINADAVDDVVAAVRDLSSGGVAVSLDALGSRQTCAQSIRSLRKQGRHVQVGLLLGTESDPQLPMSDVIANELVVLGSHGLPAGSYPQMLQAIESGLLQPDLLVAERVTLDEACQRLPEMNTFQNAGTVVIDRF